MINIIKLEIIESRREAKTNWTFDLRETADRFENPNTGVRFGKTDELIENLDILMILLNFKIWTNCLHKREQKWISKDGEDYGRRTD